jgi:nucleoside-diphosphate-sugar epimerase
MIGIIGGSGFIGHVLVDILMAAGHTVRVIDREGPRPHGVGRDVPTVRADVRDRAALTEALDGCSMIYNLAAAHRDDVRPESLYDEVNVTGAANTCAAAEVHGIERIVFASSVAIYGDGDHELDETAPARPFNAYGRTKLEAEQVFRAWAARDPERRSLTMIRPTVVFGPGNRGNVYELLTQIARGRNIIIGDGRNRKSMAYVENVASFLAHARNFGTGVHVYNYADKPDLDMNQLVEQANAAFGRASTPRHVPYALGLAVGNGFDLAARLFRRNFRISAVRVRKYCANTQFANRRALATGFVPPWTLEEALLKTIRHDFTEYLPVDRQPDAQDQAHTIQSA